MSNKLIFRILGALSASVIIVSLFVPFSALQSNGLWDVYNNQNMLYVAIIIIAFCTFAIISFSLNIKPELSYISFGACLFYIIVKSIKLKTEGSFREVNLGYYLFVLGTISTGIMSFLCNMGRRNNISINAAVSDDIKSMDLNLKSSSGDSNDLFNPSLSLQPNSSLETINDANIDNNLNSVYNKNINNLSNSTNIFDAPINEVPTVQSNLDNSYNSISNNFQDNNNFIMGDSHITGQIASDGINDISQEVPSNIQYNQNVLTHSLNNGGSNFENIPDSLNNSYTNLNNDSSQLYQNHL